MKMKLRERRVFTRNAVASVRYAEYIVSDAWRAKAAFVKETRGRCLVCHRDWKKKRLWLEVHHLSYDRLGHELPSDLVCLCSTCHKQGSYSLKEIKRDRRKYRWRKYRSWLLPWNWVWWPLLAAAEVLWGRR
jgi:hypothetical protein